MRYLKIETSQEQGIPKDRYPERKTNHRQNYQAKHLPRRDLARERHPIRKTAQGEDTSTKGQISRGIPSSREIPQEKDISRARHPQTQMSFSKKDLNIKVSGDRHLTVGYPKRRLSFLYLKYLQLNLNFIIFIYYFFKVSMCKFLSL